MMDNKILATLAVGVSLVLGAAAGENLVANPDLPLNDGLGGTVGWTPHLKDASKCELKVTPIGDGAFNVLGWTGPNPIRK